MAVAPPGPSIPAMPIPLALATAALVSVGLGDHSLAVHGTARAGYTQFTVRNAGHGEHGVELVRLRRPLSDRRLLRAFAHERRSLLTSLGGIQEVAPGRSWHMTERLSPGSYALIDFGQNGAKPNYDRGLYARLRVTGRGTTHAPRPAATIVMRDRSFGLRLPASFHGRGTVAIRSHGRESHELTLVRIDRAHTQQDVLDVILSGASAPPPWATVVEELSLIAPGHTAYVGFHLPPGRYVALSLADGPGGELQAQRGLIATFDVG
jgi:hypothetical protein